MLYDRWRKISAERRDAIALRDFASGKCWTFEELFLAGEKQEMVTTAMVFPQGHSPEFIFTLLAAWRENKVACPLESGQGETSVLASRSVSSLGHSIVHLKSTSATGGT